MDAKLLKSVGKKVFNYELSNSDTLYPDCYKCCVQMKNRLKKKYNMKQNDLNIKELILEDYYRHYVLEVDKDSYDTFIVDLTFGQFAEERQGDINIGKKENMDDVVVTKKSEYIFSNKF